MITERQPEAQRAALERFRAVRSGGQFDPPSLQGTIVFPGLDGGGEWGGAAFDPETALLYVNSNEMPWVLRLVPRPALAAPDPNWLKYGSDGYNRFVDPEGYPAITPPWGT